MTNKPKIPENVIFVCQDCEQSYDEPPNDSSICQHCDWAEFTPYIPQSKYLELEEELKDLAQYVVEAIELHEELFDGLGYFKSMLITAKEALSKLQTKEGE